LPVRLDKRKFLYVIGAITLVAWLLRLYVGWQLMDSDSAVERPHIQTDMATYFKNAKAVADGTYDYSEGFYYQPFYYTVFLPLTFKIFGAGAKGVVIVQSLLGAACVFLAGLSAAMLFGKRAGIVAAALLALARMHIFYTPYMLMAVLQSFWMVLLFYISIIARQHDAFCTAHSDSCRLVYASAPRPGCTDDRDTAGIIVSAAIAIFDRQLQGARSLGWCIFSGCLRSCSGQHTGITAWRSGAVDGRGPDGVSPVLWRVEPAGIPARA
jgi:hypothetical protein